MASRERRKLPLGTQGRWNELQFQQSAVAVAEQILGARLVRLVDGVLRQVRLVEVEAYLGEQDLAAHASKGRTPRTQVLFGPAGVAYVYLIYGLHDMFNIVVGEAGKAESILIRAAEPLGDWTADLTGPARLTRALQIDRRLNGLTLDHAGIWIVPDASYRPDIIAAPRVGIDYAQDWKDRPLRFIDQANGIARRLKW